MEYNVEPVINRIASWWQGENLDRPCIDGISVVKPEKAEQISELVNPNKYWPATESEPNFEGLVKYWETILNSYHFFGETLPILPHLWGNRGTPLVIAAYLGGNVRFSDDTVWIEPVITDWDDFNLKVNENNSWFKRSYEFFNLAVDLSNGRYLPSSPIFGDAMTVLSLLRGQQNLLYDLVDNKEKVLEKRDQFIQTRLEFHKIFWDIYSNKFPGDMSSMIWAPGKTAVCECDFSVMISPEIFIEFVVPEIEAIGNHVDYIVWHLDGPDEIKHLEILLDLPEIKAIQWVPGYGVASSEYLSMLKRIQQKGKNLIVYANDEKEVEILINELVIKGLYISGGFTGKTEKQAEEFIEMIVCLCKKKQS